MRKHTRNMTGLILLLAFCFVFTAQAQVIASADVNGTDQREDTQQTIMDELVAFLSSSSHVSNSWVENTDRQFASALKSRNDAVREQALRDVIYIAKFHGEKVTFKKVVSPLLNVYIFDKEVNHRLMTLSALHAIGDAYGMQRLRELVNDEPAEQVQRLTRRALADYYGSK